MKEDLNFSDIKGLKNAMSRMHDALGVNYTCFSEVMETLDDMRVDLKPGPGTMKVIQLFKRRAENNGAEMNPGEFWILQAKGCTSVLEAVRLYLEGNAQQFVGVEAIKNRILFLANQGEW